VRNWKVFFVRLISVLIRYNNNKFENSFNSGSKLIKKLLRFFLFPECKEFRFVSGIRFRTEVLFCKKMDSTIWEALKGMEQIYVKSTTLCGGLVVIAILSKTYIVLSTGWVVKKQKAVNLKKVSRTRERTRNFWHHSGAEPQRLYYSKGNMGHKFDKGFY
jgi:hypothetical protein